MSGSRTAVDVEREYIHSMGSALGTVFHALWNEVTWLHAKWNEFRKLFGASEGEIAILNETAPFFFRVVQDALWEGTLLHLSRLTDPPGTGQRQNLTLQRLPILVPDPVVRSEAQRLVEVAADRTAFARDWRNRRIAHQDFGLSVKQGSRPLEEASRAKVEGALIAVRNAMNHLERHYRASDVAYEYFISGYGDADAVLYHLRDSMEAEQERRRKLGLN